MAFVPDLAVLVNLLLCVVILVLGYLVYRKRNSISARFIGTAFGMFVLSHLSTLLGANVVSGSYLCPPEDLWIPVRRCSPLPVTHRIVRYTGKVLI